MPKSISRQVRIALAVVLLCCSLRAQSLGPWWPAHTPLSFRQALDKGIGFSFTFEGQRIGPMLPTGWTVSTAGTTTTSYRHASGLVAMREVRAWPEFDAIEYTVKFRNEGSANSGAVSQVNAMDLVFAGGLVDGASVVSSGGGLAEEVYPPATFSIRRSYPGPMTPIDGRVTLGTVGGRSSNKDLPFFFLENQRRSAGLFVALGWSGQWSATVRADHSRGTLLVRGGIPDLSIRLKPGEEIGGPRILLGAYTGKLEAGVNRLRRLIRTQYAPRLAGREFLPIATYDHWWNIDVRFTEPLLRQLADAAASIGQEYFLLDAGWYTGIDASGDFGIRYIRHDSNIGPLACWNAADEPDRRGMHQIRHGRETDERRAPLPA